MSCEHKNAPCNSTVCAYPLAADLYSARQALAQQNVHSPVGPAAGVKNDAEKVQMDLLPPEALEDEARAWGFGAAKYGRYNFRKGIAYTRLIAAMLRHTLALVAGEDNDPESGLPHEAHIRCCAGMLAVMKKTRPDLDDRYRVEPKKEGP